MKEYEKLAHDHVKNIRNEVDTLPCSLEKQYYEGLQTGFIEGFLKAREMALEIVREYLDASPSLDDRIEKLGEYDEAD